MKFEEIVFRNLQYWLQHTKPYPIYEKNNIYQAFYFGMQNNSTIDDAIKLIFYSLELIESTDSFSQWIDLIEKITDRSEHAYTKKQRTHLLLALSFLYSYASENKRALNTLDSIGELEHDISVRILLLKAKIARKENNKSLAFEHIQAAKKIFSASTPSELLVSTRISLLNYMGIEEFYSGNVDSAEILFRSALLLAKKNFENTNIKNNLISCHIYFQEFKKALLLLGENAATFNNVRRYKLLAQTEFTRALIYIFMDQIDQANVSNQRGGKLLEDYYQGSDLLGSGQLQQAVLFGLMPNPSKTPQKILSDIITKLELEKMLRV